jgi:CPA2 family monovalent cation:H+ antiporter-2
LAIPELAELAGQSSGDGHASGMSLVEGLGTWQHVAVTIAAIAAVVVGGSYLTRPVFRFIAMAKLRELFTAFALMMVVGIALLMTLVGLSPALGTFLAGVVLANSEYRHELESDIGPFKGLLLGLFFITVGAAINFDLLAQNFGQIIALTAGLMLIKSLVLLALSYVFKISNADRWLFSLGLAQAGEFGFVLLAFTVANAVIPPALAAKLLLVVALSMLLTPLLFILYDKFIAPAYAGAQAGEADEIDEDGSIIIAGVGRFGGVINRVLLSAGYKTVVLDHNSEHLERLRAFDIKVFFGDATRPDLLLAAGVENARMLIIAIDDAERATELVRYVVKHHPHIYIVARAVDRHHVYELWAAGCRDIIREHFDSSVRAARSALEALGHHPFDAERQTRAYVANDKIAMRDLADVYDPDVPVHENSAYIERAKIVLASHEDAMQDGIKSFSSRVERSWVPPTLDDEAAVIADDAADAAS